METDARADERVMREALRLAARALGDTSPNPVVGAMVVRQGRVVGRGYHRQAGLAHAEVEALRHAGARATGATLYVTLEPCQHQGRTPPCTDAIIAAGIRRVVLAARDPNPVTNGRGIRALRRAGIDVAEGVLREEAEQLNRPFAMWVTRKRPWVIAKAAQSVDGKIAARDGSSRWISSVASRRVAHRLRRQVDAVVVGINTVLRDDPLLTARDPSKPARPGRPMKVIIDSHLRTPLSSRCFSSASPAPALIATIDRSAVKRARFERRGIRVLTLPPVRGRVPMGRLFAQLAARHEITSVLIEGGGEVLGSAFDERLVDQVVWFVAPAILGGRSSPSAVAGDGVRRVSDAVRLEAMTARRVGSDLMIDATVRYPRPGRRNRA